MSGSGGGGNDKKSPGTGGTGSTPTPSLSLPSGLPSLPSGLPTIVPSFPSDLPTGLFPSDLKSLFPSLADDEVPYYMLQEGDCFDAEEARPGQAARRTCTRPHDAEVVKVTELDGTYTTDAALKKAASALCKAPLESRAAAQAAGTVRETLVQYPDTGTYGTGIDKVTCSLAAGVGADSTHKLTGPLR